MKANDTLSLNNTITQNPNLARRAWFWHVASHIIITPVTCLMNRPRENKCFHDLII